MNAFRNKYIRFSEENLAAISNEFNTPKIKKFSKSLVIVLGFLMLTTILSILVAYGKQSNLGIGTFTSINRIKNWDIPDNFTVI